MKEKLLKLLQAKEARKAELAKRINETEDVKELRAINAELEALNSEIAELRSAIEEIKDEPEDESRDNSSAASEQRSAGSPVGRLQILAAYGLGAGQGGGTDAENRAKALEEAEKRGQALKEGRAVTLATPGVLLQTHQATDIRPTFNEVSSLVDRVYSLELPGGESFKQPYLSGYGIGDHTLEGEAYAVTEPTFGSADINKSKITAYTEISEELIKLPAANYEAVVSRNILIALRKKIAREILLGTGAANRLAGVFSTAATAIDSNTDLELTGIDNTTLDEIIFSFGGDTDVEDQAVLVLSKNDLKAFSRLRTTDGKKFHDIRINGNTGTIDGIPFIINNACGVLSNAATAAGTYCMMYGPLTNYMLAIFSGVEIQRSTDYKFAQGLVAYRGSVFVGGNVISKNGFLRIKKAAA